MSIYLQLTDETLYELDALRIKVIAPQFYEMLITHRCDLSSFSLESVKFVLSYLHNFMSCDYVISKYEIWLEIITILEYIGCETLAIGFLVRTPAREILDEKSREQYIWTLECPYRSSIYGRQQANKKLVLITLQESIENPYRIFLDELITFACSVAHDEYKFRIVALRISQFLVAAQYPYSIRIGKFGHDREIDQLFDVWSKLDWDVETVWCIYYYYMGHNEWMARNRRAFPWSEKFVFKRLIESHILNKFSSEMLSFCADLSMIKYHEGLSHLLKQNMPREILNTSSMNPMKKFSWLIKEPE